MLRLRPVKADILLKDVLSRMKEEHLDILSIADDDYKLAGELLGSELLRP